MTKLAVIMPVYNEKASIQKVLEEWKKELDKAHISYQFILCEDGSTDGTKEELNKIKKKYNLILNQKEKRRGYGRAVIDGMQVAKASYMLCIDTDGSYDPSDFKIMWAQRKKAQVIKGFRIKRMDPWYRKTWSFLFGIPFKLFFSASIKDPSCPLVLFQKKTIVPYLSELLFLREGFWWGFTGMCLKHKISFYELPIRHKPRLSGSTNVYTFPAVFSIALRNGIGLLKLRFFP